MANRIQVTLATREGIPATTTSALRPTPGSVLAVHPRLSDGGLKSRNGWVVTHIPSGRSVGVVFATRAQALRVAEAFGERAEWSRVGPRGGASKVDRRFAREFQSAARAAANVHTSTKEL